MPHCSECGAETDPSDTHCHRCGSALQSGSTDDSGWGSGWNQDQSADDSGWGQDQSADDSGWSGRRDAGGGSGWDQPQGGRPQNQGGHRQGRQQQGGHRQGRQQQGGWTQGQGGHGPPPAQQGEYIEDGKVSYAINFPRSDGLSPVLLGGVFIFFSFLIVPFFTLFGYCYRITRAATRGRTIQPEFDDYGAMTKEGFFFFLVALACGLVGLLLIALPFAAAVGLESGSASESPSTAFGLAVYAIYFAVAYFFPAVLTLYAATGSATTALSPGRIADFAFTVKYFVATLILFALSFALQIVLSLLFVALFFTIIGIFLIPFLLPFLYAYSMYLVGSYWGAVYYEAVEEGVVKDPLEENREPYQQSGMSQTQY